MRRIVGIDPTGSTFDRIAACPASAALPQVNDGNPNEFRDRGTALHKFIDRVAHYRREGHQLDAAKAGALMDIEPEWQPACDQIDLASIGHLTTLSTEIALAYSWKDDTARLLDPVAPRQYEIDPEREVALTIDAVGVGERTVYVGDYKGPWAWLPPPERSLQLGVGALAVARIYRARRAKVEFLRLRSDGTVSSWRGELDVFGLEEVAERVRTMMAGVAQMRTDVYDGDVTPNVTEGPWCSTCKARVHCPAKTQLVRSVLEQGGTKLSLREPITPANVGSVYAMLRRAKEGVSIVEKAIRAYEADGEPSTPERVSESAIPVGTDPDGSMRYFGRFERPGREELDGKVVYEVLAEKFGPEPAAKACGMEATKEAIKDVVRAHKAKDQTIAAVEADVLAQVRQRGGSKKPPTDKPTEFTVRPDGTAKATRRKAS